MWTNPTSRRHFLGSAVLGSPLFPGFLSTLLASPIDSHNPLATSGPHFPPKAKRVIFLNMSGGVSHIDTFDPKPALHRDHGKRIELDHPEIQNRPGYEKIYLKRPGWKFEKHGQSGTEVSSLFPHIASRIDDICLVRSMHTSHSNHYNATLGMHTGSFNFARPSIGSWVSYGLGTGNRNLPSFIVIAPESPYAGGQVWSSDFLPASHQGTRVIPGPEPVADATPNKNTSSELQRLELAAVAAHNRRHLAARNDGSDLAARIRSFETAFGMQAAAPEAFDFSGESDSTHRLYGLPRGSTDGFAWQCLAARRLAERGVRFIELIDTGSSGNWDSHGNMEEHARLARNVDRPIAALLTDLKRRGMFDDTLVVWTTEFGRTPFNNSTGNKGREHHPWAFSSWLAGAGVKPGHVHGSTDEHGIRADRDPVHVHDLHATILHLLGIDHTRLTYRHASRDFRLTDVHGEIVRGILS